MSTNLVRIAFISIAYTLALAACGANLGSAPGLIRQPAARTLERNSGSDTSSYKLIYSFSGGTGDGQNPIAGLGADKSGNLYGTANIGGPFNFGTVFRLSRSGPKLTYEDIYGFKGGADGQYPFCVPTVDTSGNVYGTTQGGGSAGAGTMFRLTLTKSGYLESSWALSGTVGSQPFAGLLPGQSGVFFGTAYVGGSGNGTIFQATPSGKGYALKSYYAFKGGSDGDGPVSPLGYIKKLALGFGTTTGGGTSSAGTAYKVTITKSGPAESVIHSFAGGSDGAAPYAPLVIDKTGNLYGTTISGGSASGGVVFELQPSGSTYKETILYNFGSAGDGASPYGGLTLGMKGALYGMTELGGTYGYGTIFKLTPSGSTYTETILHNFAGNPSDGSYPQGGLVLSKGTLYGTTAYGGTNNDGTIFSIKP